MLSRYRLSIYLFPAFFIDFYFISDDIFSFWPLHTNASRCMIFSSIFLGCRVHCCLFRWYISKIVHDILPHFENSRHTAFLLSFIKSILIFWYMSHISFSFSLLIVRKYRSGAYVHAVYRHTISLRDDITLLSNFALPIHFARRAISRYFWWWAFYFSGCTIRYSFITYIYSFEVTTFHTIVYLHAFSNSHRLLADWFISIHGRLFFFLHYLNSLCLKGTVLSPHRCFSRVFRYISLLLPTFQYFCFIFTRSFYRALVNTLDIGLMSYRTSMDTILLPA